MHSLTIVAKYVFKPPLSATEEDFFRDTIATSPIVQPSWTTRDDSDFPAVRDEPLKPEERPQKPVEPKHKEIPIRERR